MGVGFAFTEDLVYMLRDANPFDVDTALQSVLAIFVLRVIIFGAFGHATYTALVGFGIGYYIGKRETPRSRRLLVLVVLFAGAWLFHFFHNGPAPTWPQLIGAPELGLLGLVTAVVPNGVLALCLAAWLYDRARRDENRWFRSVLAGDIGTALIMAPQADALSSLRRRRQARRAIRRACGRGASRVVAELMDAQISYALAKDRSSPGSPELDPPRHRIRELRRSLFGSSVCRPRA